MAYKEQTMRVVTKEDKASSSTPIGQSAKEGDIKSYFDFSGDTVAKGLSEQDEKAGTSTIYFDNVDRHTVSTEPVAIGYSDPFIKLKVAQFIATVKPLLEEWSQNVGTPEELKPIKNLLKTVESFARFLDVRPSSRLLLGATQNFFIKWGKLEEKQIKHFSTLLDWFSEGEIDKDKVKSFSQQVFLIIDNDDDEENKEE